MPDNIQERKERERQEDLAKLRGLRPIDDDLCDAFSGITFPWRSLCCGYSPGKRIWKSRSWKRRRT